MTNDKINRRDFVKTAIGAAAAAGALSQMHSVKARILGANDRINVAVIGVGGRGRGLLEWAINTGRSSPSLTFTQSG